MAKRVIHYPMVFVEPIKPEPTEEDMDRYRRAHLYILIRYYQLQIRNGWTPKVKQTEHLESTLDD